MNPLFEFFNMQHEANNKKIRQKQDDNNKDF